MHRIIFFPVKHFFPNPFRTRISLVQLKTTCLISSFLLRTRPNQSACVNLANQSLRTACFSQQLYAGFITELKSAALVLATKMQNVSHLHYS